jgi:type IV secretion system protein VirB10
MMPTPENHLEHEIKVKKIPSKWPKIIGLSILSVIFLIIIMSVIVHIFSHPANSDNLTTPLSEATDQVSDADIAALNQKIQAQEQEKNALQQQVQTNNVSSTVGINGGNNTIIVGQGATPNHSSDPMLIFSGNDSGSSGAQSGNNDTLSNGSSIIKSVDAEQILHPSFVITAGTEIHGVMETAIDSELQGVVTATVSEDVWSEDGKRILIPRGSKVVGEYSGSHGQSATRIYIIWQRVTTPPPASIAIDVDSPSADALGRSGQEADSIDTHFFERFGEASLLSIIGAGVSTQGVSPDTNYNSSNAYQQGVATGFQETATQTLQNSSSIPDTLHVYQGQRINIMVHQDLNFYAILNHE